MRFILTLTAALLLSVSVAQAQAPQQTPAPQTPTAEDLERGYIMPPDIPNEYISPEDGLLQGSTMYCLTPMIDNIAIADHAVKESLPELSKADAATLDQNGGRVFTIPPYPKDMAVIERPGVGCSVVSRKLDFATFVKQTDAFFKDSPFVMLDEQTGEDGGMQRTYSGDIKGNVMIYVSAHPTQRDNAIQAMITLVRPPAQQ